MRHKFQRFMRDLLSNLRLGLPIFNRNTGIFFGQLENFNLERSRWNWKERSLKLQAEVGKWLWKLESFRLTMKKSLKLESWINLQRVEQYDGPENFPISLGFFQLKQKLSNFRLSNYTYFFQSWTLVENQLKV